MNDKMNYCIDCVCYFLDKEKNRYFCADKKTRIEDVPCEFFEQRCDDDIDNIWHTGKPTEEGWYLCETKGRKGSYLPSVLRWNGEIWTSKSKRPIVLMDVVAWQKIEPYEEKT